MVLGISKGSKVQRKASASQAQKRAILGDGREMKRQRPLSNAARDFHGFKSIRLGLTDLQLFDISDFSNTSFYSNMEILDICILRYNLLNL